MPLLNNPRLKICGIKKLDTLRCCIENNIKFFGLIFYKKSPRNISIKKAIELTEYSKNRNILSVGVFVNEEIQYFNKLLKKIRFNYIQLHGLENNDYIKFIKKNNSIKIIKTISIKSKEDFKKIDKYPDADIFLFDYKPKKNELPGGNAKKFNWNLIKNLKIKRNWFISGGINIDNINDIKDYAIPYGIDISSGVEDKLGIKNNTKINKIIKHYGSKQKLL